MTRGSVNWAAQISVLACLVACGSSGNNALGSRNSLSANGGGQSGLPNLGGSGANNGGAANTAGVSNNGGAAGNGTSGANSQAGSGTSGTASSGTITAGGNDNGDAGNVGGDKGNVGGDSAGGGSSVDVKITGGTGSTSDVGTGGGNTIDTSTGGGFSIDTATGGGSSQDTATGGGSSQDTASGGGSSIDQGTGGGTSIDRGTGGATSIDHGCFVTTLTSINVYVIKDATPTGADTEGNMYVGGNLTASGYSVGAKDVVDCSKNSLVVGGNVSLTGGSIRGGSAYYAGTSASVSATNFDCGGLRRGKPVDFIALAAEVTDLSTALSNLTPNCTLSRDPSGALVLAGTDPVINVCNIDASQLGNVNVNFPTGSSVVVNVSGTSANWSGSAVCLNGNCDDSTQADYVVWNFYQATALTASGIAIEGSVLAPLATLDGGGGHIAGQVIVQYLKGGLEYHPYYFKGCIKWPTQV